MNCFSSNYYNYLKNDDWYYFSFVMILMEFMKLQVTEGDDGAARSGNNERRGPLILSTAPPKPSDIDDRFGRFDVKDMILGDETRSLVSDSWSTDVLGSDSELVNETMDRDRQSERSFSIVPVEQSQL